MTTPGARDGPVHGGAVGRIGLLAAAVAGTLYAVGRLHAPNYTLSLFGQAGIAAITLKSLLATIVLGLAIVQVLLALWLYHKLPLAGRPPRPVRLSHRLIGFGLFALTVPIAGTACSPTASSSPAPGWQCTRWPAASSTARSPPRCCSCSPGGCPAGPCRPPGACSLFLIAVLWYTSALWYYNGYQLPGL